MAYMTTKFSNSHPHSGSRDTCSALRSPSSQHADPGATLRSIVAPWQRQYLQFEETFFKLQASLAADGSGQSLVHTNM
jgi:hypothetical protein